MKNHICILAAIAAISASAIPMATEHYVDVATNSLYIAATNAPYLIKSKVANIPTVDVLEFNVCHVGANGIEWISPLSTWVGERVTTENGITITAANRYTDTAVANATNALPSWTKAANPPAESDPTVPSWAKSTNPPTETDPTVPSWAKAQTKPSYTVDEIDGAMTYEDTTAAIRDLSLGGIWDETLQVWWTPRMRDGNLTYEATTNINLNAGN